jgi:hypothetical protein
MKLIFQAIRAGLIGSKLLDLDLSLALYFKFRGFVLNL